MNRIQSTLQPLCDAVTVEGRLHPVPERWASEIEGILIPRSVLKRRIKQLARRIEADYQGKDLVVVAVLNGTVMFLADLLPRLSLPLHLDLVGVSSYRQGTKPSALVFTKELRIDVQGRDILLVDDILDTGITLEALTQRLSTFGPRSVRTCVLLDKPARRQRNVQPDYAGFQVPDLFVVGYGLDFAERYRNLPFIGVLRPEMCNS